ncbi:SsrA-binding protein SmpB [Buchnera aphidicola (Muscaphis stroyani)]|uniref:SsrA-binding protein n=1 Tax=Buchnera aphidicola (Muscaphis stroyani) TaxID=1241869 RepID=A0A4D6Y7C7_9GAMM|nr:SsrA-binding protein SmpB [Buchnera aphidicola]QCI24333.1 SsrA-binding protein SmpB [Buchnera aphidicola (Muscaphis stroyani)]
MLHKKKNKIKSSNIILNKKAYYDYFVEKKFESGLILQGWEVKSIRSGQINISESYVMHDKNEMYLFNAIVQPLHMSSNHKICDPKRKKKLLLHKKEINFLSIKNKKKGYTLVALSLFWKKSWCKLEFGLAKGKNIRDKRTENQKQQWKKEQSKILKKVKTIF